MRQVFIKTELQYADDGNTAYYGGTFDICEGQTTNQYHFSGNDRDGYPPAAQVLEYLKTEHNISLSEQLLDHAITEELGFGLECCTLLVDENNKVTSIN